MNHLRSPAAALFGGICLTGTMIVLFGHVRTIDDLTISHLYIVLALVVTLGSGHFMWEAFKGQYGGLPMGAGLTLLFVVGTVTCVALSGARSSAIMEEKDRRAVLQKERRAGQQKTVDAAKDRVDVAKSVYDLAKSRADADKLAADKECNAGQGTFCRGKRDTAASSKSDADQAYQRLEIATQSHRDEAEKLDKIELPPPSNADLRSFAKLYSLLTGVPEESSMTLVKTVIAYFFALLAEFGTVLFFKVAFGPAPPPDPQPQEVTISMLAREFNMTDNQARKALRTLNVPKPTAQGWVWSHVQAQQVRQQLVSHVASRP